MRDLIWIEWLWIAVAATFMFVGIPLLWLLQ